ncbi:MAG: polysaccharide biosynthesis tyrosine autokinase [Capsulimonadales bacterium]|nr:polysaccharide biosynthesis tyrosine autokinase [Capsulimonadales bacterium]
MEFWRIFRLVWGKRWLIAGIMAISAVVILVGATIKGQQRSYEAVAIISPLDTGQTPVANVGETGVAPPPRVQEDISARISELVMQLRSSNDLYLRTAELLRQPRPERTESVQRILDKNGYFAQTDSEADSLVKRAVALKEIRAAEAPAIRERRKRESRERIVASLVEARDSLGSFKEGGIELSPTAITDVIREKMSFDVVAGPLDTENNRQIVNQVRISGRFEREAEANLYVNMLCVAFIDFYISRSAGTANARLALTQEKLREARRQLEEAQRAESRYRKAQGVALTSAQENVINQYVQLQTERDAARRSLNEATAAVSRLERQLATTAATVRNALPAEENPAVRDLRQRVANARINLQKLRDLNYGEEYDSVVLAKSELKAAEQALAEARKQDYGVTSANPNRQALELQLANAQVQRDSAEQRLNAIDQQAGTAADRLRSLPEAQFALGDLRRETTIADRNVTTLAEQLRKYELQAIDESKAGAINIVSQAHAEPVGGDIARYRPTLVVFGLVLSLFCGVVLVVGMDALDNSIRTVQDVERTLKLPVVGVIPEHLPDPHRAPRVAYLSPLAPVSEAYRLLRTDLLFSQEEHPFRSLMVATGKPGQGATTTVSNLAITFAQAGKTVILVDTDLRFPKLQDVFGVSNEIGLTSVLREEARLEDALLPTDIPNLLLLPAGPPPLHPSELLADERMRTLHERLKRKADFLFFDTPSAIAFADASVMAAFVDATLLVVRANNVPRGSEDQVMRLLNKARANIIGVTLNGVPSDQVDSVHYHEEYYPALPALSSPDLYRNTAAGSGTTMALALPGETDGSVAGVSRPASGVRRPTPASEGRGGRRAARMRRPFSWHIALVALALGIVLGTIVLRVATSVNVR